MSSIPFTACSSAVSALARYWVFDAVGACTLHEEYWYAESPERSPLVQVREVDVAVQVEPNGTVRAP